MTQKQCQKQFNSICKKYNNPLLDIAGEELPTFIEACHNGYFLAGRSIYLSITHRSTEDGFSEEYNRAHQALKDLIYIVNWGSEEGASANIEQLSAAYLDLLKIELRMGTVRIPCTFTQYKPNTKIRSRYSSFKLNYSPVLTDVASTASLEDMAKHLADCLLHHKKCSVLTFNFKHGVAEEDLPKIQKMATQMSQCFNKYFIEEFKKKKSDPEYQFRNDWDPTTF